MASGTMDYLMPVGIAVVVPIGHNLGLQVAGFFECDKLVAG